MLAVAFGLAPAGASAEPVKDALPIAAEGAEAYGQGRFDDAILKYQEVYKLTGDPVALFNVAKCLEAKGNSRWPSKDVDRADKSLVAAVERDLSAARSHYERFLSEEPQAENRALVQQKVRGIGAQIAILRRSLVDPPPPEAKVSAVPWVIAGIGGAAFTASAVLGGLALSEEAVALDPTVAGRDGEAAAERAEVYATATNGLLIGGGVLSLIGGIWGIVDIANASATSTPRHPRHALSFEVVPFSDLGLTVIGRF